MKKLDFDRGCDILNRYSSKLRWENQGQYVYTTDVCNDELSIEDMEELCKLGFCGVDSFVGFEDKSRFTKTFEDWWTNVYPTFAHQFDGDLKQIKTTLKTAMLVGVAIGALDKTLAQDAMESW